MRVAKVIRWVESSVSRVDTDSERADYRTWDGKETDMKDFMIFLPEGISVDVLKTMPADIIMQARVGSCGRVLAVVRTEDEPTLIEWAKKNFSPNIVIDGRVSVGTKVSLIAELY